MQRKIFLLLSVIYNAIYITIYIVGCATTHLDKDVKLRHDLIESEVEQIQENIPVEDVPRIVYIEKPVYIPKEDGTSDDAPLTGQAAVTAYQKDITKLPEYNNGHITRYTFNKDYVYEVHCQPYRATDIELEAGEAVLEMPFISEPDVWQLAAGEAVIDGVRTMHFFVKPDQQQLTTSLIIITDRRVYHIELKSFKNYYMPIVRWSYPGDQVKRKIEQIKEEKAQAARESFATYSFNYKVTVGWWTKVLWVPKQVYDDGRRTYIVLDEECLHQELPALFNEKNEIVNYRVDRNILVVDQLIKKMTLALGKDKVTIRKKR